MFGSLVLRRIFLRATLVCLEAYSASGFPLIPTLLTQYPSRVIDGVTKTH